MSRWLEGLRRAHGALSSSLGSRTLGFDAVRRAPCPDGGFIKADSYDDKRKGYDSNGRRAKMLVVPGSREDYHANS